MTRPSVGFSELATAAALTVLFLALVRGAVHESHDVALLLEVGERLLAGQRPYVDYVETNPPLAHYLHAGVVALARAVGVKPLGALWALTWSGTALACAVLARGARPVLGDRGAARSAAGFACATILVAAMGDFAQRDHLFVLLFVPWWIHRLRVAVDAGSTGQGMLAGAVGAVGVCIKPHFLLVALALEVWVWTRARGRAVDAGLGVFCATGLLYPAHVLFWPDEVREAFFGIWVPVLAEGYRAYGNPVQLFAWLSPLWGGAALLGVLGLSARSRGMGVVACAALGVYFLQNKGWFYHLIPALTSSSAAGAAAIGAWGESGRGARVGWLRAGGFVVGVASVAALGMAHREPDAVPARMVFQRHVRAGDRVLLLSTELPPAYPWLPRRGAQMVGTYPVVFPLAVLFPDGHRGPFGEPESQAERVFRADLAADLDRQPTWILLDERHPCPHCGPGVSFPRYLDDLGLLDAIRLDYERIEQGMGLELLRRRAAAR